MDSTRRCRTLALTGLYVIWLAVDVGVALEAPVLKVKGIQAGSALIFFYGKDVTMVSQWMIEYRDTDANTTATVNSTENQFYVFRLSGLDASTKYQVRAKALKIREGDDVSGANFSQWYPFNTTALSIFGRVDFANVNYTDQHKMRNTDEWNATLGALDAAYFNSSHVGISIVEIVSFEGKVRVHYRVKIRDKRFPSTVNFTLATPEFVKSYVNYNDTPAGTPYAYKQDASGFFLVYIPNSMSTCKKIVERYMMISPERDRELDIHLNVANSDATTADEEDGIKVQRSGDKYDLVRDDGLSKESVTPNQIVALTPRFLVKDCLKDGTEPMYTEFHHAMNASGTEKLYSFFYTAEATTAALPQNEISITTTENRTSFAVRVPRIEKAVECRLLNGSTLLATLTQLELEDADRWEFRVEHQSGDAYSLTAEVTLLKPDGTTHLIKSSAFSIAPDEPRCTNCSRHSSCTMKVVSGEESCACPSGYLGDGYVCELPTTAVVDVFTTGKTAPKTTPFEPTPSPRATTSTTPNLSTGRSLTDPGSTSVASYTEDASRRASGLSSTTARPSDGITDRDRGHPPDSEPNVLVIVLPVVIVCLLLLLAAVLIYWFWRHKKRKGGYSPNPNGDMPQVTMQLKRKDAEPNDEDRATIAL